MTPPLEHYISRQELERITPNQLLEKFGLPPERAQTVRMRPPELGPYSWPVRIAAAVGVVILLPFALYEVVRRKP